jgi:oligopeptide transport system substrate-binding protein
MKKIMVRISCIIFTVIMLVVPSFSCAFFSSVEVGPLDIIPVKIAVGEPVNITTELLNKGKSDTDFTVELKINGKDEDVETVTVAPGVKEKFSFRYTPIVPGNFKVEIGGQAATFEAINASEFKARFIKLEQAAIYTGQEETAAVEIENPGTVAATMPVKLLIDGKEIKSQSLRLEAGATDNVLFSFRIDDAGKHSITVNGADTGIMVFEGERYRSKLYGLTIFGPKGMSTTDVGNVFILNGKDGIKTTISVGTLPEETGKGKLLELSENLIKQTNDIKILSQEETLAGDADFGYRFNYSRISSGSSMSGAYISLKKGNYRFAVNCDCPATTWLASESEINAMLYGFVLPQLFSDKYIDNNSGFSISFPRGWQGLYTGVTNNPLIILPPGTDTEMISLYVADLPANMKTEDFTTSSMGNILSLISGVSGSVKANNLKSRETKMGGGIKGYSTSADFNVGSASLTLRLTAAVFGGKAFIIVAVAHPADYDTFQRDLDILAAGLTPIEPAIYGIEKPDSLFLWYAEIPSLDPALSEMNPGDIIGAIFSGLIKLDKDGKPQPDLAEKWDISPDGKVFTFHLREAAKFQDGRPVTASDFKYSWERACKPSLDSPTASTFLGDIVGAREVLAVKSSRLSGVKVIDDHTLQVTIDAPRPYFLEKLAQAVGFVVDKANVSTDNWTLQPNGTGPFKLKQWKKDEVLILERSENYYGDLPGIKNIVFQLFAGVPMLMYETGRIDIAPVDYTNLDKVEDASNSLNKELLTGDSASFVYLGFNVNKAPFDDPNVRKAFAMALDLNKITEVSLKDSAKPAAGIIPDGVPGFNGDALPLAYEPEKAKKLLAESKYSSNIPSISMQVPYGATPLHQAMISMWKQNLGIDVKIEVVKTYDEWIKRGYKHDLQLFTSGWHADYLDPQDFMDILFQSQSKQNLTGYSSKEFDDLVNKANIEKDPVKRIKMYQDLEAIVLKDLPIAPIYRNEQQYMLVKPQVKGYQLSSFGLNQWASMSVKR